MENSHGEGPKDEADFDSAGPGTGAADSVVRQQEGVVSDKINSPSNGGGDDMHREQGESGPEFFSGLDIQEIREGWRDIHRRLLRHSDLKLAEKEVLRNIMDRLGKKNTCWPSQATIAWDCNLSRQHVNVALKGLCDRGFITKKPRQRRQAMGYQLNVRALLDWAHEELEPYPLDAIPEDEMTAGDGKILTVGKSDIKIKMSENPTHCVGNSDSACQKIRHPEVIPVKEDHRSNSFWASPKQKRGPEPCSEADMEKLRQRYLVFIPDFDEVIATARAHEAWRKYSNEYLYLNNWLSKDPRFRFPKPGLVPAEPIWRNFDDEPVDPSLANPATVWRNFDDD